MDSKRLINVLGTSDKSVPILIPKSTGNIPSHVLGKLAKQIPIKDMENIALFCLGFSYEFYHNTRHRSITGIGALNLAILEQYSKSHSPEVIFSTQTVVQTLKNDNI